jgi:anti-anti-sigma factor
MGDDGFEVSTCVNDERLVVTLAGEVDLRARPAIAAVIDALHPLEWAFDIDVSQVTFIDSSGLHALRQLGAASRRDATSAVNLIGPSPSLQRVLEFTGLDREFALAD